MFARNFPLFASASKGETVNSIETKNKSEIIAKFPAMIDVMTDRNAAEFYSSRLSELKEKGKTKEDDYLAMYYEVTLSLEQQMHR